MMRVLLLYAHPVESSYGAALHAQARTSLEAAGHEVDDCDLYAEGFNPVLSREERLTYHDIPANRSPVQTHVDRLERAEALVIVSPVWNFGFPAILKGYFDRVWLPGVSFDLVDGGVVSKLQHIRKLAAIMTYGATPMRAFLAGDPPRKIVKRYLRVQINPYPSVLYLTHYDMNRSTDESRKRFLQKVRSKMERF
jgi:putative NADPH-quinone reductase